VQIRLREEQDVETLVLPGRYTVELAGRRGTIDVAGRARVLLNLD
jgi:hypothetical protein